jgi:hypothetical protein
MILCLHATTFRRSAAGERSMDARGVGVGARPRLLFKTSSVDGGVDGGGADVGVAGELADAAS